jgi:hypothetical protein
LVVSSLQYFGEVLEEERIALCGPRYAHNPQRPAASTLFENLRCAAIGASRHSARRRVAASLDLNSRRDRIEVRFEHG